MNSFRSWLLLWATGVWSLQDTLRNLLKCGLGTICMEGEKENAFIHWIPSPICQDGSTFPCYLYMSVELLPVNCLPSGQKVKKTIGSRTQSCLTAQLAGSWSKPLRSSFCYRAWSKRRNHRGFKLHKRPPTHLVMINYVSETLWGRKFIFNLSRVFHSICHAEISPMSISFTAQGRQLKNTNTDFSCLFLK